MAFMDEDKGGKIPYINKNAIIAGLLGGFLLVLSYWVCPDRSFWQDITHEIGFALLVAVVIWTTFEFFSRAETDDRWNKRIERIIRSVFNAVFKRNFPDQYIREANSLVFEQSFLRSGMNVTYTMEDGTFQARNGRAQGFVKLNAVARHKVKNVGTSAASLPIVIGLPNPLIDEMKAACKVHAISMRRAGGQEVKQDISLAQEDFRKLLLDDSRSTVKFEIPSIMLQPEEDVELTFNYTMAKEEEDTEVFQTRYPAESLTITILDRGPTHRVVRAKSIHAGDLDDHTSPEQRGTYNFGLPRYLLPHQGFVIWWKKVPSIPKDNFSNQEKTRT